MGLHFLAFWPCGPSLPFILAFRGQLLGARPTSCQKWPVCPTSLQWIYQRRDRLHFAVFCRLGLHFLAFGLAGLHFLAFWPCGPSFPCILALWASFPCILAFRAFISLHFGLLGLHFRAFWPFGGQLVGSHHKLPKMARLRNLPYKEFSGAVTDSILQFCAFWAISLHFGLAGLHFLAFWPCGLSFPCIFAFWAFISLHFGLAGLHFLAPWPFGPVFPFILALWAFISFHFGFFGVSFWAPPSQVAKNGPFAQRPYNGFISAVTGSILQFLALWAFISLHLALWAFISLHFGLVGIHFLAFWPCGPISLHFSFFGVSFWGPPPQVAKNGPFAQRPYNGFISAVTGSILQFLALWAFISLHFGLVGLHFLAFWLFRGQLLGSRPTSCQKWPVCPTSLQWIYQRRDRLHFAVFSLVGVISLHFGLVGLHFLAFWPCGPSFPCILAVWAFISFHFRSSPCPLRTTPA